MRVLHCHAGLARTSQPVQHCHSRPRAASQPGVQLRQQRLPPGQEHRPRRHPQRQPRFPGGLLLLLLIQLGQLTWHAGAQPLHQALQVTELRRPHRSGHLLAEPGHQRRPRRIQQIRQPHIRDTGAQQRHPRDPGFPGPPELQLRNRQPLRIILRRDEPVPVPRDQHIQITGGHIIQAAAPHRVTIRQVTVHCLMPGQPQPVKHRRPLRPQVRDRRRHIHPGHHHPRTPRAPGCQAPRPAPVPAGDPTIAQRAPPHHQNRPLQIHRDSQQRIKTGVCRPQGGSGSRT